MRQALWLEDARTNLITESENFGASTWAATLTPTRSSSQADPYGDTNAWLLGDNGTTAQEFITNVFVPPSTTVLATSLFMREGSTTAASGSRFLVFNNTASVTYGQGTVTWSSGVPTLTVDTGSTYASPEQFAGGWWRMGFIANGSTNAADTHQMFIYPAVSSTDVGDVYVFGAQVE